MLNKKSKFFWVFLVAILLLAPVALKPVQQTLIAWADEEEDEEDERDEEEDEEDENEAEESDDEEVKEIKTTTYKTVTTKLPDQIVERKTETLWQDGDGDGLYDEEDPHPTINDYYIVSDTNLNGLDDRYEQ